MNHIHLIGRLGADPVITPYHQDKQPRDSAKPRRNTVSFDLAVERPRHDPRTGEIETDLIPVTAFDGAAGRLEKRRNGSDEYRSRRGSSTNRNQHRSKGESFKVSVCRITHDAQGAIWPKAKWGQGGKAKADKNDLNSVADTACQNPYRYHHPACIRPGDRSRRFRNNSLIRSLSGDCAASAIDWSAAS